MKERRRLAEQEKNSKITPKIEEEITVGPQKLTKFELTRVLGARALQISMGAPPLIEVPPGVVDPIEIAMLELEKGVLDIYIERRLPSGKSVLIHVKKLKEETDKLRWAKKLEE